MRFYFLVGQSHAVFVLAGPESCGFRFPWARVMRFLVHPDLESCGFFCGECLSRAVFFAAGLDLTRFDFANSKQKHAQNRPGIPSQKVVRNVHSTPGFPGIKIPDDFPGFLRKHRKSPSPPHAAICRSESTFHTTFWLGLQGPWSYAVCIGFASEVKKY